MKLIYNQKIIFNINVETAKEVSETQKQKNRKNKLSRKNDNASKSPKAHLRSDLPKLK